MKLNYQNLSSVIKNYKTSQNSFLSKDFFIPLEQEYTTDYKSLVNIGDEVNEGQVIASSIGKLSEITYIHSSVPGQVMDILPVYTSSGKQKYAINIKLGGKFSYLGKKIKEKDLELFTSQDIISELINKGVVNTFNIKKIYNVGLQIKNSKSKNLIVRLFDEDPFRFTDSLTSKFYPNEIITGAKILAKAMNASGILFVIDSKFENKSLFDGINISNFRFLEIKTNKTQSVAKREIISAFSKSNLKKSCNFEVTKNDFFTDSSTLYEVYKAVVCNIPSISRLVHFSGNCLYSSCILDVKFGTPLKDIVNQLGGFAKEPSLIVINGLLYGNSVESLNVPITKSVKSVEFINKVKFTDSQIYSCVNCGNCRYVCPSKLSPDVIYSYVTDFQNLPQNITESIDKCESCFLCNTVCPARLPLTNTISWLKEKLKEQNIEKTLENQI